jgi:hypothetical protein
MASHTRPKTTVGRLGRSTALVFGVGGVALLVAAVAGIALISWLTTDKAELEARRRPAPADTPDPSSPEAAVGVARRFFELMTQRNFAEAALMVSGPAATNVQRELGTVINAAKQQDPEFAAIVDQAMRGTVFSFEPQKTDVAAGGQAVTVDAKATVSVGGQAYNVAVNVSLRWAFDRWMVHDYRVAGSPAPPAGAVPTTSQPGPQRDQQ